MRILASIDELKKSFEPGSVVFVPSMLLSAMSRHLDARLVERDDGGIVSPLYVFEVDPYITVAKEVKKEYGLRADVQTSAPDKVSAGTQREAKIRFTATVESAELRMLDPSLIRWAHVFEALNSLMDLAERHKKEFAGRPVLLYTRVISPEAIERLASVADIGVSPAYVAVPIPLTRLDPAVLNAIDYLSRRNIGVGFLFGIELDAIGVKVGGKTVFDLLPHYLVEKTLHDALPESPAEYFRDYLRTYTYCILYRAYTEGRTVDASGDQLSISTVFLDALRSVVLRNPPQFNFRHNAWNESYAVYAEASELTRARTDILAAYAKFSGVQKEVVELIKSTKLSFPTTWIERLQRAAAHRVYAEEAEENVLPSL